MINHQEAAAFYNACLLRSCSRAEALDLLSSTYWPPVDGRHHPTIRRLARAMLRSLDARVAAASAARSHTANRNARFAALDDAAKAAINEAVRTAAVQGAGRNRFNRKARDLAASFGIQSRSIDDLAELLRQHRPE